MAAAKTEVQTVTQADGTAKVVAVEKRRRSITIR